MTTAELAQHEAGHAAAAGVLGIHVRGIYLERDDRTNTRGRVDIDPPITPEGLHRRMILTLAGLLESDRVPGWPLRKDRSMDERHLAVIAEALDLDAADYERAVDETFELTLRPEYKALHTAVVTMCGYTKHIDTALFERLQNIANPKENDMEDETFDLDAELAKIKAREAEFKTKQIKTADTGDAMSKALNAAYAKADRAHRIANEHVEVKSFAC